MSITERLKSVMESKNMSIKMLSEQLDIPYRTLQNYLLNERTPSVEVLVKISQFLKIDLNWLILGEEVDSSVELTDRELNLISHYRLLDKRVQEAFLVSFEQLSKN